MQGALWAVICRNRWIPIHLGPTDRTSRTAHLFCL